MKKTAALLAIGATVLGALAADRADDGRGLIEAYASNNSPQPVLYEHPHP